MDPNKNSSKSKSKSKEKDKKPSQNKKTERDPASLLQIGEHPSLCSSISSSSEGIPADIKKGKEKRIHESIIKLGIVTHSFDRHHLADESLKTKMEEEKFLSSLGRPPRSEEEAKEFVRNVLNKYSPKTLAENKDLPEEIVKRVKYVRSRDYNDIDFIRDFVDPDTKRFNYINIGKKEFEKTFINDRTRNYFMSGNKVPWKPY